MKGDRHTMKSLILTTQDARELDKLGGLTIMKPIKPAPRYIEGASFSREADCADIWHLVGQDGNRLGAGDGVADVFASPVEVSDVVFIREPWYRLKNPQGGESERVILAADSVVQPEQAAYKWASPVSMPQDAARRFARVKSIEPAYGENVTPAWLIELVAITKEEATAEDGAPLSTSDVPEEASSYYAYAGDMNAEDRDRMIAKIDADRARLAEVQDRLIRIDLRRRDLSALMFEERDKVDPNDRDAIDAENTALDEEQGDLAREEADLRAALEDAKAPAPTVEEHAREKYTNISALLSGPSDAIPTLGDYDALKAEEQVLARYIEQYDKAATEPDPAPTEEDEEIGSFRLGKCKYCGREWGVTLEGAREGGFPTQRTADAAATRLCDCEEAVANRAPVIGVAMAVTTGACRYCGQIQEVGPHPSQAAADGTATEVCNCPTARQERRVHEQVADACERVQRLFGDDAESLGFKPIPDEAVGLLENVVEMIARGPISSASLNVRGRCKAKFSVTSKGKIKVSRSETRSCDLEDGE